MKELFQPAHELVRSLLEIMQTHPDLPVIQLPAPNHSTKAQKSKPRTKSQQVIRVEFIELERNLASLGFFSASSKRTKTKKGKTLTLTKTINGHKVKVSAEIIPGSKFGLPSVADQEKWFAFCHLLSERRRQHGKLTNPIRFSSGEILKMLNQVDSGRNYEELNEWLDVMSATTIISNGALYRAGQKTWVAHGRRRFHVFDRADSRGTRLDNGTILDKHEVDLSMWQLENVNAEYFLLFDHPLYVKLKKSIAKTLLPLLHTWLFAARRDGRFEKLYPELCEALQITHYSHRSRIAEQLQPALNELVELDYLSKWELLKTSSAKTYKIAFFAGPKAFHGRRRQRKPLPEAEEAAATTGTPADTVNDLLQQLERHGISDPEKLLSRADNEFVADCIRYWETQPNVRPALLVSLIRRTVALPVSFKTTRQLKQRQAREQEQKRQEEQEARLAIQYRDYCEQELERYITANPDEFRKEVEAQTATNLEGLQQYKMISEEIKQRSATTSATGKIRSAITERICPPFEQWKRGQPDSAEVLAEETPQTQPAEKTASDKPLNAPTDVAAGETPRQ